MTFNSLRKLISKLTRTHRSSASTGPFGLVPQELLDLILSYLVDDKAALLSCALVHPTWTGISRYRLPALTLVVSSPSRAKELTKLLRSSRETLSSSIAGINLVGDVPFDDISTTRHASCYRKLLHALKVKGTMLSLGAVENDPSLVGMFAQYFPELTELKVICASYQDITSFMRALAGSFPRLSGLSIELGGLDLPDASLSGLRDLRLGAPCLRSLRVVGWNNDLVRWLGDNVVGTLERLGMETASVWSACHPGEAISLIQGNMETLRDVRLCFVKRDGFDLSGLVHLENFEFAMGMREMELGLPNGWRLPRSLKRAYIRNVDHMLPAHCRMGCGAGAYIEEGVLFEGAVLRGALGLEFDRP
ncbi:hypothetical protein BDZ89DRAFT_1062450 [Hymenopellis radicata]|nr:hypothetical protein BDZ89DRAFT_1062450 [Hymenopellis radicata]